MVVEQHLPPVLLQTRWEGIRKVKPEHRQTWRMIGDILTVAEVSLAENTLRAAMRPADQVEAFRRLLDAVQADDHSITAQVESPYSAAPSRLPPAIASTCWRSSTIAQEWRRS